MWTDQLRNTVLYTKARSLIRVRLCLCAWTRLVDPTTLSSSFRLDIYATRNPFQGLVGTSSYIDLARASDADPKPRQATTIVEHKALGDYIPPYRCRGLFSSIWRLSAHQLHSSLYKAMLQPQC